MSIAELLKELNESQRTAVTHVDGPLLILAGPGSGKTRVVTHRIAYLIDRGVDPRSMVALTFTNKAADEMRSRIERLVGQQTIWLGTFHGFCVRLLRRYARMVGLPENFSIYDVDDAQAALKSAVQAAKFELTHISLNSLANRISYFKNRLVTPEILEAEALSSEEHAVAQVYPYYQNELLRNGAVDFDDILMHTATLLRSNPELRSEWDRRLRYVMVDEYQDTNLAQYVIVRHLCVDYPNLAATGDPDQSIYGWRGANAQNVTYLERDYPDLKIVRLENNYRSTPEILSVADYLIQHNEYRKSKNLLPTRESGRPVCLTVYPTARDEAEDIAEQMLVLTDGGANYGDFAVLYRTNAQSRLFEHALMRRQIPFQLIGGFRFYLRKEIKDLVAYLLLVHNPDDNVALQRAINSPSRGIGKQTLDKIAAHAATGGVSMLEACRQCVDGKILTKRAIASVKGFLKIYDQLCSLAHGPLLDLLETAIDLTQYREYLVRQTRGGDAESEAAANLDELLAEAHELDGQADQDRSPLERFLEFVALQSDTDRLDSRQEKVTLMTLHAAKGLEFPYVFMAAVEENILPHARSKDDPMALEEERRLMFVGITRAEMHLQISYAKRRGFSGQGSGVASSFLIELPRAEMQVVDKTECFHSPDSHWDFSDAFDEGQDPLGVQWDDYGQWNDSDHEDRRLVDAGAGLDECQLPPDEIKAHLLRTRFANSGPMAKRMVLGSELLGSVRLGSDLGASGAEGGEAHPKSRFPNGCWVEHERFGVGQIIASQGHGLKRSVTIHFSSDASRRTFRLSHVQLKLVEN